MTPEQYYRQQLEETDLVPDTAQEAAVTALQDLYDRLIQNNTPSSGYGLLKGLLAPRKKNAITPERGIYLWGGVGRGKTWLVDLFYNLLPTERKLRLHFHQFMRDVHEQLARLKGLQNPLDHVAKNLSQKARIICLDEFIVTDIGDAMILAGLLKALFNHGVTLVTTSNTPPDNLYQDGIQRASFLPAIDLLNQHTQTIKLDGGTDYRLRYLEQATIYHTPLVSNTGQRLKEEFDALAPEVSHEGGNIHVFGRNIPVRCIADDAVWFDFMALCGPPRSQADYLELARSFHTVLISDIPRLGPALDDATRRFLYLVDEFYDRNVKLIISAAEPPESLYQGERLAFDFQRAVSRLQEMQSTDYLAKGHRTH
ncbi:cell division protein ZapE [Solemya velesiana gill symbiont]|uniref:Cell division protein ZapE n=1 Tax=Solemya velesiana gill symbiont TaxID=1918948 RepID=A0A1T2KYH0_9GAMM|nr:cell division protein ZapE [Solemya velesiana gill symbiont]OOZ37861.1 cell division protein ZapE [Solemya velesiana gill symbiont]